MCELCFGSLWGNVGFELNGFLFVLFGVTLLTNGMCAWF